MPTREDYIALALVLGAVAVVGVTVWVLSRRKASPQRIQLKKIGQGKVTYQNLEEHEIFEPEPGRIIVKIRRKVVRQ